MSTGRAGPAKCMMCGGTGFEERLGVLETRGGAFFNLTWVQRGKTEYICQGCGYIHAFAHLP